MTYNFSLSSIILLYLCNVILYFITFAWLVLSNNKNCICDLDIKTYLQYYIITLFVLIIVIYYANNFNNIKYKSFIFSIIVYILLAIQLIVIYFTFQYIKNVTKKKCKCDNKDIDHRLDFIILITLFITAVIKFIS